MENKKSGSRRMEAEAGRARRSLFTGVSIDSLS